MKKQESYSKIIDFKDHKLGPYDIKTFVKDWGSEPRRGVKEKRCKIVKKRWQENFRNNNSKKYDE